MTRQQMHGLVETSGPTEARAVVAVLDERDRQDEKWGEQNHDPFTWLAVLNEEVGEYAKEALEIRYDHGGSYANLLAECV